MTQATTPTFTLTVPNEVDLTQAAHIYFTLIQGANIISKSDTDLTVTAHSVEVFLTQAETLPFKAGKAALQLNWTYPDGSRACSNIASVSITANLLKVVVV